MISLREYSLPRERETPDPPRIRPHYTVIFTIGIQFLAIAAASLAITPASSSDGLVSSLTRCQVACTRAGCDSQVMFVRNGAGWRPLSLVCEFESDESMTDRSFASLEELSPIESLDIYASWTRGDGRPAATPSAFEKLASLHLHRLGYHQNLSAERAIAICSIRDLQSLDLALPAGQLQAASSSTCVSL